jgi:CRISPR-associated endonuclease/helicase Cas3
MQVGIERVVHCWGKTSRQDGSYHPALYHMLDVGHVAGALLNAPASRRFRSVLARTLGSPDESLADWLPYLVALHDIGKISATFQAQQPEQRARLASEGFVFGVTSGVHHALVSQVFLPEALAGGEGDAAAALFIRIVAEAAGGHHGRFQAAQALREARPLLQYEPAEWRSLRLLTADMLRRQFRGSEPTAWPVPDDVSSAIMALSGFVILCDWLGSDERHFPCEPGRLLDEYPALSESRARTAVEASGFSQATMSTVAPEFRALFPGIARPRPLQEAIDAIPGELLAGPCLAILEAPTGEGKTEAALALAHRLAAVHGSDELYYALPTMATSNQMFVRLERYLGQSLGLKARAKLAHGQASLIEESLRVRPPAHADRGEHESNLEWFSSRKRALLAPFGVGTIDQVELAALNVPHAALRMMGLAGKVVVFDEVHAYDTYITTIVERVLAWLRALGASVILLSATLPSRRREALARAFGASGEGAAAGAQEYPSLWVYGGGSTHHMAPAAFQPARRVGLHALGIPEDDAEAKARWLVESVAQGGCACWVANTVARAQGIFEAVDRLAPGSVQRTLLHARFPLDERETREKDLAARYGPSKDLRSPGIVVGTQVLEQSLDLDFDVMVSDLAPVDLLLQRAGRLHRHDRPRPVSHLAPNLWLNVPQTQGGRPDLRVDRWVYSPFLLERTWDALLGRLEGEIRLPQDYRILVEEVYSVDEVPEGDPLAGEWRAFRREERTAAEQARLRLLPLPDPEWAFTSQLGQITFEESETRAGWIVAQTRLSEESVMAIPLERQGQSVRLPDGTRVSLDEPTSREMEVRLLRRQVRVSNRRLVEALRAGEASLPALFARSTLLRGTVPLWLSGGRALLPHPHSPLVVTLDDRLGLIVEKEGG